ncbi:MAG: hypothetical protein MJZ24_01705 [Paludibacteraceae bacterium]|nr:hypothetical protein [Paludibacteraceae bacterium]
MSDSKFISADGKVRNYGGYNYSAPSSSATHYAASRYSESQLPKKVDLRPYMTRVEDQGQANSCTANAVAGAYEYLVKKNEGIDYDVSRLFIYYTAREKMGEEKKDCGSVIAAAIEGLEETGACSEHVWPYSDQKNAITRQPSNEAYNEAEQYKISDTELVPTNLNAWKHALAEGFPIIFGVSLFGSFDQQRRKGYVPDPSKNEVGRGSHGSHAMLCVGYSDVDRVFIIRNSWGDRWGDKGYCYMSYDYIMNKKYNHGDSWIIRGFDEVEDAEQGWSDDDESVLVDLCDEFANMDDETWEEMNEEMGEYSFPERLGLLFAAASCMDDEISEEERSTAIEYLATMLEAFGYDDLDPEGVFDNATEIMEENEDILDETLEIFSNYLSGEACASIVAQLKEVAGADGLDGEESDFIDNVESILMSGGEDDEEEEEEEGEEEEECEEGEDDEEEDLDDYDSFTATIGGPDSDECSYISICDEDVYSVDDEDELENVEIVFTGKKFISADEADNEIVCENGNSADIETIEKGERYAFETSTGYTGYIVVEDGKMGKSNSEIEVTIYYAETEEDE